MSFENSMPRRQAVKLLLFTDTNEIVTVTGGSGWVNLPGGGVDANESPALALTRELYEEVGLTPQHIRGFEELGEVSGEVTSGNRHLIADWTVYGADLTIPVQELYPGAEIKRCDASNRSELIRSPRVSNLAKQAIIRFT